MWLVRIFETQPSFDVAQHTFMQSHKPCVGSYRYGSSLDSLENMYYLIGRPLSLASYRMNVSVIWANLEDIYYVS